MVLKITSLIFEQKIGEIQLKQVRKLVRNPWILFRIPQYFHTNLEFVLKIFAHTNFHALARVISRKRAKISPCEN